MGKIKSAIDKFSGTESASRTAGEAIEKLDSVSVTNLNATTVTVGETELDEEKLTALLALLN